MSDYEQMLPNRMRPRGDHATMFLPASPLGQQIENRLNQLPEVKRLEAINAAKLAINAIWDKWQVELAEGDKKRAEAQSEANNE